MQTTEAYLLLVEDNPDDAELTMRALRQGRIANPVTVVRDGEETLAFLQTCATLPQLVLLDLKLPKIDGLEVLRRVRADDRLRLLPVVIFTTSNEQRDIIEGYRLGTNSYIRKPVDSEQFFRAVQQLHQYWLLLNTPPGGN